MNGKTFGVDLIIGTLMGCKVGSMIVITSEVFFLESVPTESDHCVWKAHPYGDYWSPEQLADTLYDLTRAKEAWWIY